MSTTASRRGITPPSGAALIWTLEVGLGEKFTPELRAAWIAAYTVLSGTMIEAAREEALVEAA